MVKNKFKLPKTFLPIILLIAYCLPLTATVRYVSHEGSNTPPYLTWETAADSIMSAINISVFGDTIYVANGVYEEQVIMIPGLSLIGAGMDSCVIDTRNLVQSGFWALIMADSCILKGFNIIVSNGRDGRGLYSGYSNSIIEYNKIVNTHTCISISNSNTYLLQNILINAENGIELFNSNSKVINNNMFDVRIGVEIDAFTGDYYPVVEKNIIRCTLFGIKVQFNSSPIIRNNVIFLNGNFARGYSGGGSDSVWIYNNVIIAEDNLSHADGFANSQVPTFENNNIVIGEIEYGISFGDKNYLRNNLVMNAQTGIKNWNTGSQFVVQYSDTWNNDINYSGFVPDSTNLSVDPMIVNEDSTQGELDFHLQMFSPLIDVGDPNILDVDGSRSDIGLWGGPYGEMYTYRDLAPKPPSNLTADYDSGFVLLRWNRNTEADFYRYRVYRDTVPAFIYDTTKIIAVVADTFYYDDLPEKYIAGSYYYKLTAMDSTEHQSATSEEVKVIVTGAPEGPPIVVEQYKLLNNYPNPFNPSTTIPYRLKEGGHVRLTVYNLLSEKVAVLVDEYQEKGYYEVVFNPSVRQRKSGKIGSGVEFPTGYNDDIATGIYIYDLIVSDSPWEIKFSGQGKMILLK